MNTDDLANFPEEELQQWLANFVNDNEYQSSIVHQQWDMLRRIEEELFRIKVKQDIIVASLQEYIQEWLNSVLKEIVNPSQS